MNTSSVEVQAESLNLHALERNRGAGPALLFLHGWLDHCHSFDWVCEALPASFHTVALDFRGHGRSAHLPHGVHYHFGDYLADVRATLETLGLRQVHLVGHSMGGAVALLFAAACPERVQSVFVIESLGPLTEDPEDLPTRLGQFVADLAKPRLRRLYASVDEAAAKVRENNSALPEAAARHLSVHGLRQVEGGYEFTFDPTLRRKHAAGLDEAQTLAILRSVRCPVRFVHGSHGFSFEDDQSKTRLSALRAPAPFCLPGGHHVHMEQPEPTARLIQELVRSVER